MGSWTHTSANKFERYKFAMQDVKTILSMPGDKVGAAIWKLANEMQHRLNRVIAQQKAMG